MAELKGRTLIITGASRGIGRENRLLKDQTGQAPEKICARCQPCGLKKAIPIDPDLK
jgi:hypothetical protein